VDSKQRVDCGGEFEAFRRLHEVGIGAGVQAELPSHRRRERRRGQENHDFRPSALDVGADLGTHDVRKIAALDVSSRFVVIDIEDKRGVFAGHWEPSAASSRNRETLPLEIVSFEIVRVPAGTGMSTLDRSPPASSRWALAAL
jgi:hypothetical protein